MRADAADGLPRRPGRRDRLARERTEGMIRRRERLEAEVAEQLEPLLGPAGGPVGETARAHWRRTQVDAYLTLPPWRRAWRTWCAWARSQRAATFLGLAALWTVVLLPLRMLGLAGIGASQVGVATLALLAPVAAFVPPTRRGRFVKPLPPPAPPWRGSRAARTVGRAGVAAVLVALLAVGVLTLLGPGPAAPPEGVARVARQADVLLLDRAIAGLCGPASHAEVTPRGPHTYLVALDGGTPSRAEVVRSGGFEDVRTRVEIAEGAAICPPA